MPTFNKMTQFMLFSFVLLPLTFKRINTFTIILILLCLTGYIFNFQNIFQYCPDFSQVTTIGDINLRFAISVIGIFIAPIGIVTGFIW